MQIHEIKCNPTLQIPLYPIHRDLLTDIQYPAETDPWLGNGLIHALVRCDSSFEIALGFFARHSLVVGIAGLDFQGDVGGDDGWVVAEGFEEEELQIGFVGDTFTYLVSKSGLINFSEGPHAAAHLRSKVLFVASVQCKPLALSRMQWETHP